jgi:hypothetical protein
MAYSFANASTQYLIGTIASGFQAPMTLCALLYPTNVTAFRSIISITDEASGNRIAISGDATGPITAATVNVSAVFATSSANQTINTWQGGAGVFTSASSRAAYVAGGNVGTEASTLSTANLNRVAIGARFAGSYGATFDGFLAECAIWNVALTAAEVASLAKGFKPSRIRPQSLIFYSPMVRNIQDVRRGVALTNTNSATVAAHPRVY